MICKAISVLSCLSLLMYACLLEAAPALPERRYGPEESQSTPRKRRKKKNSKSQLIVDG